MQKRALFIGLLVSATSVAANPPVGFGLWKASVVHNAEQELSTKIDDQKFSWQGLGTYDNHLIGISHREGDGSAELHETQTDIMIVETGKAKLIVGGTMVAAKTVKPHEVRGTSVSGGQERELGPGDIVNIPSNIPHQLKIAAGTKFTYLVVKVDNK
jgi:mannose-6-phosphate isomerase-like protein (cupin superfamily)